jgi:hypothetical protein
MIFTTLGFLLMLNTNNFGFSIVNSDTSVLEEHIHPTYQPSEQPIYRSLPSGGKDGRKGGKGGGKGGKGGKGGRKRGNNNLIETYEQHNHENEFIKRLNDNIFLDEPIKPYIHDFNENPKHSSHIFIEEIVKDNVNKTQDLLFFQLTTEVDYISPHIIFMSECL